MGGSWAISVDYGIAEQGRGKAIGDEVRYWRAANSTTMLFRHSNMVVEIWVAVNTDVGADGFLLTLARKLDERLVDPDSMTPGRRGDNATLVVLLALAGLATALTLAALGIYFIVRDRRPSLATGSPHRM